MSRPRNWSCPLPWFTLPALALALASCAPTDDAENPEPIDYQWLEEDDSGNEHPGNPEEVDTAWLGSVTILGSASSCDYDSDEDWPWTGDNDSFLIEVPEDGYLEATLDWTSATDFDLIVYFQPPGPTASPDHQAAANGTSPPESYLFENEFDEGDEIVLTVACTGGPGGDYSLTVSWED